MQATNFFSEGVQAGADLRGVYAAPLHSCKYRWLHAPDLNPQMSIRFWTGRCCRPDGQASNSAFDSALPLDQVVVICNLTFRLGWVTASAN
jgi:hypothetical protein